jgi:hypothetical protein
VSIPYIVTGSKSKLVDNVKLAGQAVRLD